MNLATVDSFSSRKDKEKRSIESQQDAWCLLDCVVVKPGRSTFAPTLVAGSGVTGLSQFTLTSVGS